jgi:Holliday junction DNA helicase RuvA
MIELRDKVEKIEISDKGLSVKSFGVKDDAIAALIGLGYNQKTADKIIRAILGEEPNITLEELVKKGLMNLNN